MLSREEADGFRQKIIDMVPRDLNIPFPWGISAGRIKPYHEIYHEQETRYGHEDDGMFDTPELMPLLCNETVYRAAARLMGRPNIRVQDGTIGITLRNDDVVFRPGAFHNRRARTRVAYFTRYSCLDHPFYPPPAPSVDRFNTRQVPAMGPIGGKLTGVDAWD